tara:strand:+ start:42 stop:500 length:459 start_codon:yes stop_codon:yes gene_type:complete
MGDKIDFSKYNTIKQKQIVKNLTNIEPNDLSLYFFSEDNIDYINKQLQENIFELSKKRYGKRVGVEQQEPHRLLLIMREVYLNYLYCYNENSIEKNLDTINNHLLKIITPDVFKGLIQHVKYLNDYNDKNKIMPLPIRDSNRKYLDPISRAF